MRPLIFIKYNIPLGLVLSLNFCASKPICEIKPLFSQSATFLQGIWHGFKLPFSLLGKIFNLNLGIHETTFIWIQYWIGYLIGFVLLMKVITFFVGHQEKI